MKVGHIYISSLIIFLVFSISIFSCSKNNKEKSRHLVNKWLGKELFLPHNNIKLINLNLLDTTIQNNELYEVMLNKDLKIVSYIDGGCSVCIQQLEQWNKFIKEFHTNENLSFIIFVSSDQYNSEASINKFVAISRFSYPLILDLQKRYILDNKLPEFEKNQQTFLLDEHNKVLLVGNPILNENLQEIYSQVISGGIQYIN